MNNFASLDDFDEVLKAPVADEAKQRKVEEGQRKLDEINLIDCHKCGGTGRWKGIRECFTCRGKGKITKERQNRVRGAAKAKRTQRENLAKFHEEHAELISFMIENAGWNNFFASMIERLEQFTLTENQLAACERSMAKTIESRRIKQQERDENAPKTDASKIHQLFQNALDAGKKRRALLAARFDEDGLTVLDNIKMTPARDGERIWVKVNGEFCGGINSDGSLRLNREAPDWLADRIIEIASNPREEARLFGQRTGTCCCCNRELTDPVSIAAGIGPICATNWGL